MSTYVVSRLDFKIYHIYKEKKNNERKHPMGEVHKIEAEFPELPKISKSLKRSKETLKVMGLVGKEFKAIVSLIGCFKKLSESLKGTGKAIAGVPPLMATPFVVYDAVNNALLVIRKKSLKEKIRPALNFITNINSLMKSVAFSLETLNKAKLVGEKVVQWIPIFNIISFATGFISVGLSIESTARSSSLLKSIHIAAKDLEKATDDVNRARILQKLLQSLEDKGIEPLRKKLMISKKADLEKKISKLSAKLLTRQGEELARAVAKSEKMMKILKKRAGAALGYNIADLSTKVVGTAGAAFSSFTPLPPVGYILLAISTTSSLVIWSGKTFFVNKNPFDPVSRSKAGQLLDKASHAFDRMQQQLKTFIAAHHLY